MLLYIAYGNKGRIRLRRICEMKAPGVKKIVTLAFLSALSLTVFVIEAQLPPMFIPGAKLGLANIFSLFTLVLYGPIEAVALVLVRTLLGTLVTGTFGSVIYSLTAGIIAVAISGLLVRTALTRVSVIAVSVASAVVHNIVQNLVFVLISSSPQMLTYMPYLALIGAASGALVGAAVYLLVKHLPYKTLLSGVSKEEH